MLKLLKFLTLLNIYYCHTYVGCSNLMLVPTRPGVFSSVIIASRVHVSTFLKRLCILHALTHTATRCVGQQWPVCPHRQVKLKPTGVNQCCFNSIKGRPVDLVFGHADLSFCDLSFIFHRAVLKLGRV